MTADRQPQQDEGRVRVVTPEQYAQGFRVQGWPHPLPLTPYLIRRLDNGNYLIREPRP